jgi:hypothetical protein
MKYLIDTSLELKGSGIDLALRQGLKRVARKTAAARSEWCGGDLGSPRKPAGPPSCRCGLPVKARSPPQK